MAKVIYVGVTSDLVKRVCQHKTKAFKGFTSKYLEYTTVINWFILRSLLILINRLKGRNR